MLLAVVLVPVGLRQLTADHPARTLTAPSLGGLNYREVRFANGPLTLAGLLFRPDQGAPFPGAVIIHGSGSSRRDNGWYLSLVSHLQHAGIAVLLPDKRGSERSDGDWRTADFATLAEDARAALAHLGTEPDLTACLGIIGLSQGGHIAPVVASGTPAPAFIVNVVGAAVSMHEQLYYEEVHNLEALGLLPGISHALAWVSAWTLRELRQPAFWRAVGDFDPLPYWRNVTVPALVLYGERDSNVPTAASVALFDAVQNPAIEVTVYAGSGHALESPPGTGSDLFRRDALEAISAFIGNACDRGETGGRPVRDGRITP